MTRTALTVIAQQEFARHGLTDTWTFKINTNKRRLGVCRLKKRRIELSVHMLSLPDAEIRDTLLHEIAHAKAGHRFHNAHWRAVALSIGCSGTRCGAAMLVTKAFRGVCPRCGQELFRHRRKRIACVACCDRLNHGKFSEEFLILWSANR